MIQHIRLNALMAAMWINYLLLIVVSLSIYNINYLTVMPAAWPLRWSSSCSSITSIFTD